MSAVETNNGSGLPDRFCLSVVSDYIAANWADFSDYVKQYEVDPEDLYQQISGGRDPAGQLRDWIRDTQN